MDLHLRSGLARRSTPPRATMTSHQLLKIACIGTRGLPSNYSGLERACEGLYTALVQRGHTVTVYCRSESASHPSESYRGIQLRSAPAIQSKQLETLTHAATSLIHALRCRHYDLIHLHALAPSIFSRLCRASGIPTVSTVQGLDWQRAKWKGLGAKVLEFAELSMVRNVDQIVVVSRDLQQYYADRYGRETTYIPNGVEPVGAEEYEESTVLKEFGLKPRGYILYLGRLVPEKRVEDLIAGYRGVRTDYKLVIAGEGCNYPDLRRIAVDDKRIIFIGHQEKPAVHQLLHHAAIYASASALEGLPMSLLECLLHGTPAVVSDIPPHRELLGEVDGYDLFFPPGNVELLRMKLEAALQRQGEYRRVAKGGQRFALEKHSWPEIAERTEAVLYRAVDPSARDNRLNGRIVGNFRLRSAAAGERALASLQNKAEP
jgi:glycosyltransferase involved in cell wall biosynthesis